MPAQLSRRTVIAAAGASATSVALAQAASPGPSRLFRHAQGEIHIPQPPRRIAVLDLGALDILQALSIEVAGLPNLDVKLLPPYLKKHASSGAASIGDLFQPDLQALRQLQPDLVIVGGRSAGKLKEVGAIAPAIDISPSNAAFLPSIVGNILLIGRLVGREAQAAELAERLLSRMRALHERSAKAGSSLLLFGMGDGLSVQYPGTRFGSAYDLLGVQPIVTAAQAPPPWSPPPRSNAPAPAAGSAEAAAAKAKLDAQMKEFSEAAARELKSVMQRNPDWLFVIDRTSAFGERPNAAAVLQANNTIRQSKAWKQQQVLHLDGGEWYLIGNGPTMLERAMLQFEVALDRRRT